jgi:hypothetical protein
MTGPRDDYYAAELTAAEQRILDTLLARLPHTPDTPAAGPPPPIVPLRPVPRRPADADPRPAHLTPSDADPRPAHLTPIDADPRPAHLTPIDAEPPPGNATPARSARSAWSRRAPLVAAAAAAAVLLSVGVLPRLLSPVNDPATPAPTAATASAPADAGPALRGLAAAAGQAKAPAARAYLYRERLDVRITGNTGACTVDAYRSQIWVPADGPAPATDGGRLTVTTVDAGTLDLAGVGCRDLRPAGTIGTTADGPADDIAARWTAATGFPPTAYVGPRWVSDEFGFADPRAELPDTPDTLGRQLDKWCANAPDMDCGALRWAAVAELLTSPETTPAQRKAALLATDDDGVSMRSGVGADVTGRPGVTLRVPHLPVPIGSGDPGVAGTADLTFDPATGALLQRSVTGADGQEITVFLAAAPVPDDRTTV